MNKAWEALLAKKREQRICLLVGSIAVLLIMAVPLSILRGWVLTILWGWFVMPTFPVEPLGIAQAIGLSIFVTVLAGTHKKQDKQTDATDPYFITSESIGRSINVSLIFLGLGWMLTFFL